MNDADLHSQEIGDSSFGDLASRRVDSSASCLFASVGRRFDLLSASWPPGPTRRNSSVASFVEHNPGVALPDAPIEPVARYEASGSTEIFTGRAVCRYSRAQFLRQCSYVRTSQDCRGTFARARIRKSARKGFYTSPVSTAHLRGCLIHTIVNTVRFHGCFVYYIARVSGPSARAM